MMTNKTYKRTQYEDITLDFSRIKKVIANYIDVTDSRDADNDLIRALPPIRNERDYYADFKRNPICNEDERTKSTDERRQLVYRLYDYRTARSFGYPVDLQIADALRNGYRLSVKKKYDDEHHVKDSCNPYYKIEGKTSAFALIGPSGVGKTTTLISSLNYYPQVIIHESDSSRYHQVTYIKVECPPLGSMKSFYDSCLSEFERALDYEIPDKHRYKTLDAKEQLFKKCADRWNLGLLVIDEIQNLLNNRKNDLMNQFLTLSNDLCVPIIFVGTDKIRDFFKHGEFFMQRRIGVEIKAEPYYYKDPLWHKLLEDIWQFQWMKEYVPLTAELKEAFFMGSAGLIDRVVSLFLNAQMEAIRHGIDNVENFNAAFINRISSGKYELSQDNLNALRRSVEEAKNATSKTEDESNDGLFVQTPELRSVMANSEQNLRFEGSKKDKLKALKDDVVNCVIASLTISRITPDVKNIETIFNEVVHKKDIVDLSRDAIYGEVMRCALENAFPVNAVTTPVVSKRKTKTEVTEEELPRFEGVC